MPSVIRQEDLDDMVEGGVIPHEAARLLGREIKPQPRDGECMLLATHIDRGFISAAPSFLPEFPEFLRSAAPALHSQLHCLPCCVLSSLDLAFLTD